MDPDGRPWTKRKISGTTVLTPALSSKERGKRSPRLWNVARLGWFDDHSHNRKLPKICPLLGERNQVREVVEQIPAVSKYLKLKVNQDCKSYLNCSKSSSKI